MEHPKPLGAIPRNPDPRDWMMSAVLPQLTSDTQRTWDVPILLDQGATGSCVTNAWTGRLTDTPIEHPDKVLLDPTKQPSYQLQGSSAYWPNGWGAPPLGAELYAIRLYDRIHDGVLEPLDPARTAGCQTSDGGVILKRRGLISGYYRAGGVDDVITAILTHGPVIFASPWYPSMDDTHLEYGNRYVHVDLTQSIRGYHCYLLPAVNLAPTAGPPFVVIQNSWGKFSWGLGGKARLSIENLHSLYINNAWICTETQPAAGLP